jgi:hypothetical protein
MEEKDMNSPGEKSSPDDGWKESCDLPNEGKSQEDQQTMEEEDMTSSGEKISPDDGWQESCNLPNEEKSQEDQQTMEEEDMTSPGEKSSPDDGWQKSCDLPCPLFGKGKCEGKIDSGRQVEIHRKYKIKTYKLALVKTWGLRITAK